MVSNFPDALALLLQLAEMHKRALSTDNDGTWTTPSGSTRETFPALLARLEGEFGSAQAALYAARDYVTDLIATDGAVTKTTKALLDADLDHDAGTAALVLNDLTLGNNGLYIKEGSSGDGEWVFMNSAPIALFDARLAPVAERARQLVPNARGYRHVVCDAAGYVGVGITPNGEMAQHYDAASQAIRERLGRLVPNPRGYVQALVDENGYVGSGVLPDGTVVSPPAASDPGAVCQARVKELAHNPRGYVHAIVDQNGYVGSGMFADATLSSPGTAAVPSPPIVYVSAGDGVLHYVDDAGDHATSAPAEAVGPVARDAHIEFASDYLSPGALRRFRCRADEGASCLVPEPGTVVNMVVVTGQSNSVGTYATRGLSRLNPSPTNSLMFNGGLAPYPRDDSGGAINQPVTAFAPMAEAVWDNASYPDAGETCSTGFARQVQRAVSSLVGVEHRLLVAHSGVPAFGYASLKNGTQPFANLVAEINAAKAICDAAGLLLVVRAAIVIHGETDWQSETYAADLAEWQADIEAAAQAATGQTEDVPMLITQFSAWNYTGASPNRELTTLRSPWAQYVATETAEKIHLACPGYMLAFPKTATANSQGDALGLHYDAEAQRRIGAYCAKAYRRVVLDRQKWHPLRPLSVNRAGEIIDVTFRVPVEPLVLDTTLVSDPGHYGFEYTDDSGDPPAISSVAIAGDRIVRIVLDEDPGSATGKRLRYGFTSTPDAGGGPTTGPRGCLRDSDATTADWDPSVTLPNHCVHFNIAIN